MSDRDLARFESSLKRRKWIMNVVWALIIASPFALSGYCVYGIVKQSKRNKPGGDHKLSAEQLALMEERYASAMTEAKRRNEAFLSGFEAATQAAQPGEDRCPIRLEPPKALGKPGDAPSFAGFSYHRVRRAAELTKSKILKRTELHIRRGRERIERGFRRAESVEDFMSERGPLDDSGSYEVVLVVDKEIPPFVDDSLVTFRPGSVDGRAYVWDHRSGSITCVGKVAARSSEVVSARYSIGGGLPSMDISAYLRADLKIETERTLASSLRSVASPAN